jgi:hypothetical protein
MHIQTKKVGKYIVDMGNNKNSYFNEKVIDTKLDI